MCGHDYILGSDVTYAAEAHDELCSSLAAQLETHSPGARAIIAHQHRAGTAGKELDTDKRLQSFTAAASAHRLRVRSIRKSSVDQGGRSVSLLSIERDDAP